MRRALAIGVLLVAAAPAPASGEITAGPVIAGDGAAWADLTPGGAVRVLTLRPEGRPVVARRWAQPRGNDSDRRISAVAAGTGRGGAVVTTCTSQPRSLVDACAARTFAGPFARLRGPLLPERVAPRCPRPRSAEEVAMSGGWTAVLSDSCLGRYAGTAAFRRRIEARRGGLRRIIPLRPGHGLRLAGRHLAWQDGHGGAVLYDLRRGERTRRIGSARGQVGDVDVQADGTLALVRSSRPNRRCVSTLPLGGAERTLDCWFEAPIGDAAQTGGSGGAGSPPPPVAVAGGRVLYVREARELVLRRPGGAPEAIARFAPELRRVGDIDLGPHGATWAEQPHRVPDADGMPGIPVPAGAPRVVIRPL